MSLDAPRAGTLLLIDPATGVPLSRLRSWLAIAVMLSGTTFVALVVAAIAPVMHAISEHFGQNGNGKNIAYGMAILPSIGIMIGGPITGWVIDRVGSRSFLLAALTIFGLMGSAGLYLDNVWILIATRFVLGLTAAGIVAGTLIMIGEYFDPDTRARVLGYQGAVGALVVIGIFFLSGQLADLMGWRGPFLLYLTGFVVLGVVAVAIPKRPKNLVRRAVVDAGQPPARQTLLLLLPTLILVAVLFIGSFMPTLQVSFLLAANGVLKPSNQALVFDASAIMVAAGAASYSTLRHRMSDRGMLRLSAISLGLGIVTMGLGHDAWPVVAGCMISGIGTGLLNPQVNNMLITRAGENARGRAVGLGYTARYAGDFMNPVIVGPLTVAVGIHYAVMAVGVVFLIGAAVDLLLRLNSRTVSA
jgi:MFS family permease